jgi:hypothetical protein
MFQLSRMSAIAIFCSGLILGGALIVFLGGTSDRSTAPAANAADPKGADTARFQVSACAFGGYSSPNGTEHEPGFGAYIIDTQNGDIWFVSKDAKPKRFGKAE